MSLDVRLLSWDFCSSKARIQLNSNLLERTERDCMQMNKHLVLALTLLLSVSSVFAQAVIGGVDIAKNPNLLFVATKNVDLKNDVLISRAEYVISYNRKYREMNWASWVVSSDSIGHSGRSGKFATDDELENYLKQFSEHVVGPNDYKGSCFDRGHQIPSGDRTSNESVNRKVFFMSNMIPQTAHLNKGAWEGLESYIRERVTTENKKAYIIAGPIFDQDFGKIGPNKDIKVPSKNFKIVVFLNPNESPASISEKSDSIAVIMPNDLSSGKAPNEDRKELCDELARGPAEIADWEKYKTTIKEVQKVAGFKFFNF